MKLIETYQNDFIKKQIIIYFFNINFNITKNIRLKIPQTLAYLEN